MIKLMNSGLAALIAATSIAAAATPVAAEGQWGHGGSYAGQSRSYGHNGGYGYNGGFGFNRGYDGYRGDYGYGYERHDHDDAAPLIIGGLVGIALIAALASSHSNHAQTDSANAEGAAAPADNHPDVCTQQHKVWDPNAGQYVSRSYRVAC